MLKGYLFCLAAGTLWGCIGPFAKVAYAEGMTPLEVAFWRTALAWVFFAVQALASGRVRVARRDLAPLLAFGVLGVAGAHGFYCLAVQEGGAALAAVLLYTAPAWVTVLSFFFLQESLSRAKIIAVILTIAGVGAVSYSPSDSGLDFGLGAILFGLASGFSYSLYYIFAKKLGRYPIPTLMLYALPAAALILAPLSQFTVPTVKAALACLGLALVSTYLAFLVYYAGLQRIEASRAAVATTCEPLVAGVLAHALFGEYFGVWGYVGGFMILGAVLYSLTDSIRQHSTPAAPSRATAEADAEGP